MEGRWRKLGEFVVKHWYISNVKSPVATPGFREGCFDKGGAGPNEWLIAGLRHPRSLPCIPPLSGLLPPLASGGHLHPARIPILRHGYDNPSLILSTVVVVVVANTMRRIATLKSYCIRGTIYLDTYVRTRYRIVKLFDRSIPYAMQTCLMMPICWDIACVDCNVQHRSPSLDKVWSLVEYKLLRGRLNTVGSST